MKVLKMFTCIIYLSYRKLIYITGIKGVSIKNVSGWYSVKSTGSIKSISYTNNHQQATVDITYQASAGAGNNTYSGTAKISVY